MEFEKQGREAHKNRTRNYICPEEINKVWGLVQILPNEQLIQPKKKCPVS